MGTVLSYLGNWGKRMNFGNTLRFGHCSKYLGNWGKRMNFGNSVAEILTKVWERKRKSEREKILNFGNVITEIPAAQTCWPSRCEVLEVGCPKETNCGNAIAKLGGGEFVAIVAMPLLKMGGKKKWLPKLGEELKKKVLRSQYFYNIFTTNHRWLIIY